MDWIKTIDQLPEDGQRVIALYLKIMYHFQVHQVRLNLNLLRYLPLLRIFTENINQNTKTVIQMIFGVVRD